jgi:hypothetical protein
MVCPDQLSPAELHLPLPGIKIIPDVGFAAEC